MADDPSTADAPTESSTEVSRPVDPQQLLLEAVSFAIELSQQNAVAQHLGRCRDSAVVAATIAKGLSGSARLSRSESVPMPTPEPNEAVAPPVTLDEA